MSDRTDLDDEDTPAARWAALHELEEHLELPMIVLGVAWLVLLVVELTRGLTPALEAATTAIWLVFLAEFALGLVLAPSKRTYLRTEWLTALSLLVPALRVFRLARVFRVLSLARAVRGVRLVRVVTSLNRGIRSVGGAFQRRGAGYVWALTMLVLFGGAAGMYTFERDVPGGLPDYGTALWWTAMLLTTMGSETWPQTAEGRVLCLILSLYGFAMFGYVTAALASLFVRSDRA